MIKEAIVKIVNKEDLTYDEAYAVMNEIMSGETSATQNAAFLAALSTKSARAETTDEIAGCAAAMRAHATKVETDMELFEKIKLHLKQLLNNIREAYKKAGLTPTSDEAKALLGMTDVLDKMYSLFEEASVDAVKNYQGMPVLETEPVSVSEDGNIRMQMKQYETSGRSTLLKYLKKHYGAATADDLISTMDNLYDAMSDLMKDESLSVFGNWQTQEVELDGNGHPIFTTSITNGDYKLNQDFSRVCKKR